MSTSMSVNFHGPDKVEVRTGVHSLVLQFKDSGDLNQSVTIFASADELERLLDDALDQLYDIRSTAAAAYGSSPPPPTGGDAGPAAPGEGYAPVEPQGRILRDPDGYPVSIGDEP